MTFTYDLTNATGKVRLLVPDNDLNDYELEDAEIGYFLSETGQNVKAAAAQACRWLARKYSRKVSFTADGLTVRYSERAAEYARRADELAKEVGGGLASVELDKSDGFSDEAASGGYANDRTVYIRL